MSALNRFGLGVMLWVMIFLLTVTSNASVVVTFITGLTATAGLVLFVYEGDTDG